MDYHIITDYTTHTILIKKNWPFGMQYKRYMKHLVHLKQEPSTFVQSQERDAAGNRETCCASFVSLINAVRADFLLCVCVQGIKACI